MSEIKKTKLTTEAYKGVRDFYPEDQAIQNYIFGIWKKNVEKFGYQEYTASVLEPAELYKAKSGEEIINEQTYTFIDRGDREVTLRPEMTPTVARMVAAKKRELVFPLRWYSIPNLFRYEQPQRGRLREHWQLNVDIFGVETIDAEVEVIQIASQIMKSYGLSETGFEIRLNNRKIMNYIFKDVLALSAQAAHALSKIIDKKEKIAPEAFKSAVEEIVGEKAAFLITLFNSQNFEAFVSQLPQTAQEHEGLSEIKAVISGLEALGIRNVVFNQTLMRGFDYYTGIVFEIFDTNPANRRSVFGGGRYDELLALFGNETVSAVGFGAGDVVARDILETYKLIPKYSNPAIVALCPSEEASVGFSQQIAELLRENNISASVDYSDKKIGDKIKNADKNAIPYVIVIGEDEIKTGTFKLKNLASREEIAATSETIIEILKNK